MPYSPRTREADKPKTESCHRVMSEGGCRTQGGCSGGGGSSDGMWHCFDKVSLDWMPSQICLKRWFKFLIVVWQICFWPCHMETIERASKDVARTWQSSVGSADKQNGEDTSTGCACDPFLPCDPCHSPCGGSFPSELSFSAVSMRKKGFAQTQ